MHNRKFFTFLLTITLSAFLMTGVAQSETYKIDPDHSSITFKIRHLVSKTQGKFNKFSGTIDYDSKNPKASGAQASIETASIDTGVTKRDEHLKSKDFFNVTQHPTMTFKSTKVTKVSADGKKGELVGNLTLKGVSKPVVLDVEIGGIGPDPWGKQRAGFTGKTTINRKDYGMTFNIEGKDGGMVIGDEVEITLEIEAIKE